MSAKKPTTRIDHLINKYAETGSIVFSKEEAMELFLSYASGTSDSRNLMENIKTDGRGAFFDLTQQELHDRGLGDSAVFMVSMFPQIANRCLNCIDLIPDISPVSSAEKQALKSLVFSKFIGVKQERVLMVLFGRLHNIIDIRFMSDGNNYSTSIDPQKICSEASAKNAFFILLAHNHPSGSSTPSNADYVTTITLGNMLDMIGIKLIDHYIVTRSGCESITSQFS